MWNQRNSLSAMSDCPSNARCMNTFFMSVMIIITTSCLGQPAAGVSNLAPALYVFGDSYLDDGNVLNASVNFHAYSPYGIDFPGRKLARWTNGKVVADIFATLLGLEQSPPPFAPYYLNKSRQDFSNWGVNYASAGTGILNDTRGGGTVAWSLGEQVERFEETVKGYLPKIFRNDDTLSTHLSKSIVLLHSGSNDFVSYLFDNTSTYYGQTSINFSKALLGQLENHLEDLYRLGAKKFVLTNLDPFGCHPYFIRLNQADGCVDELNRFARTYNHLLEMRIERRFNRRFKNATFVRFKTYEALSQMAARPTKYGLINSGDSCCEVNPSSPFCKENGKVCEDRDKYLYFDGLHPTEAAYKAIALSCFNKTRVCVPINFQSLAQI